MLKVSSWAEVMELVIDIFIILAAEAVMAVPIMFAWNCVVPVLTKLPELGYWQTFSLMFLTLVVANSIKRSK